MSAASMSADKCRPILAAGRAADLLAADILAAQEEEGARKSRTRS
jgi:hypothetical protein